VVVSAILWGNADRLMSRGGEFSRSAGAAGGGGVWGFLAPAGAAAGRRGELLVLDVAPIQIANTRRKLAPWPEHPGPGGGSHRAGGARFDACAASSCSTRCRPRPPLHRGQPSRRGEPGGKIVFVDYHKPRWWHPMGPVMALVFRYLEPFANSLLAESIDTLVPETADFEWRKETFFGGLYQKVVGIRR
jgi:hypothetical protein